MTQFGGDICHAFIAHYLKSEIDPYKIEKAMPVQVAFIGGNNTGKIYITAADNYIMIKILLAVLLFFFLIFYLQPF